MTTLLQEEERLGQLLLQLADVDADLVIQLDPETGGETTVWPVNFTTHGNSVQCTSPFAQVMAAAKAEIHWCLYTK